MSKTAGGTREHVIKQRTGRSPSERILSDTEPLDTIEQEKLIRQLEFQHRQQANRGTWTLSVLFIGISLLYLVIALRHCWLPFENKLLYELNGVNTQIVCLTFIFQALTFAFIAYALPESYRSHVWGNLSIGSISWGVSLVASVLAFQCCQFAKSQHSAFRLHFKLWWLILGGPLANTARVLVIRMFASTSRDLEGLRRTMYEHKTL